MLTYRYLRKQIDAKKKLNIVNISNNAIKQKLGLFSDTVQQIPTKYETDIDVYIYTKLLSIYRNKAI